MKHIVVLDDTAFVQAINYAVKKHIALMVKAGYRVTILCLNSSSFADIAAEQNVAVVQYCNQRDLTEKLCRFEQVDYVFCESVLAVYKVLRAKLSKHFRICLWVQGALSEESFLRHKSYLRYILLSVLECFALACCDRYIFVSDSMKQFYRKRAIFRDSSCITVPCLCDFPQYDGSIKKIPNSYVYIGGLSVWQCFEEIVKMYSRLRNENTVFHIITLDVEEAERIVKKHLPEATDISIYPIRDRKKIPEILSQFEYGFLVRRPSPVNFVSSPIKFLEYLACGVNVIMTDAVPDYAKLVRQYQIGTIVDFSEKPLQIPPYNPEAVSVSRKEFNADKFVEAYKKLLS